MNAVNKEDSDHKKICFACAFNEFFSKWMDEAAKHSKADGHKQTITTTIMAVCFQTAISACESLMIAEREQEQSNDTLYGIDYAGTMMLTMAKHIEMYDRAKMSSDLIKQILDEKNKPNNLADLFKFVYPMKH